MPPNFVPTQAPLSCRWNKGDGGKPRVARGRTAKRAGLAHIRSVYAPEFCAHTGSAVLQVE